MTDPMNISDAAKLSGINAKMIRHYEAIGLVPRAARSSSGYREYSMSDVNMLSFVGSARRLGFSMKEIKKLLGLWRNKSRNSAEVKNLALRHIDEMEQKISELEGIVKTLKHLAKTCRGDHRPDCPILESLERAQT